MTPRRRPGERLSALRAAALALVVVAGLPSRAAAQYAEGPTPAVTTSSATTPAATSATPAAQPDREIQIATDAFVKDATLPGWVRPHDVAASKTAGPAVVVLSDSQVRVGQPTVERTAGRTLERTVGRTVEPTVEYAHRAIQVNDATALSGLGRVALPFIPAYQRLVLHRLRVVRDGVALDRLADAQVRFLQRETGLENNLYSGIVTASILIDDLRLGDVLDVAYSTIGTNPVFGTTFSRVEGWDQLLPTDERRVIVSAPEQRQLRWRTQGLVTPPIDAPAERVVDGIRTWTFEGRSIAGLPPEPALPSGVAVGRSIEFSEYADWQGVAAWAATLFVDDEPPSAERVALVAKLKALPTVEQRVVGALEFVQSQVRYFSVSLGTSSHRPALPNTVITRRYGDCKDKSLLLVTLLRDLGIDSTPVLARLGNRTGFDDRLPTPLVFDHVIVKVVVDGSTWWLDATRMGQHGRLARMGQVHDGAQVLVASPTTPGLERITVANRDELTRDERTETLVLPKIDGDGTLQVVQTQNGVSAEVLRGLRGALPQERLDAAVTADFEKRYAGARLIESVRIDDDPDENRATIRYGFTLPKPAKRVAAAWQVALRPDNLLQIFVLPGEARRRGPVAVRYPVNAHYTFTATLPDDVAAALDPAATTIDDPAFVATTESTYRGNHATVNAEVRTRVDRVSPQQLTTLRDDLQKLQRGMPGGILVRDVDLKKSGFLGIGQKDLAATMKARQQDTVTRISATLDAGRLSGSDLARAYCDRAAARLTLGQDAAAASDADQAVAVDPNAPDMLVCRGEIRVGLQAFAAAVDDLSKALVLGAETGRVYYVRGQARFHLGRYADAADDFAKANVVDKDERSSLAHDLWRAMAYRRMDRALPDDLQRRAIADPRGAWPRPVLALFAGSLGPDDLGPLAARDAGDAAALNGTEADFFVGEYWLSRAEAGKARDAFRAARARGVIVYTEYGAAAIELDKLDRAAR